jgi:hypothetical protein
MEPADLAVGANAADLAPAPQRGAGQVVSVA